jgi:hypothetical protein
MRVRHLVAEPKEQVEVTEWRNDDIPPRYAPCFTKTYPQRNGWEWRSAKAKAPGSDREYILLCRCHVTKDDWKATLILKKDEGGSVVSRFEFHSSHPGLHIHASCDNGGELVGPVGMSEVDRLPNGEGRTRRTNAWTKATFWQASKKFFRVQDKHEQGELIV